MSTSYSIGSVFGIPVRVHITLLIFLPLFALSFAPVGGLIGLFYGALGAVGLFGSVVLHEVGHSLVARAKGSRILEILLLPIGGMARLNQLPRKPADEIQTALAGPAVSLILGVLGLWPGPFHLRCTDGVLVAWVATVSPVGRYGAPTRQSRRRRRRPPAPWPRTIRRATGEAAVSLRKAGPMRGAVLDAMVMSTSEAVGARPRPSSDGTRICSRWP